MPVTYMFEVKSNGDVFLIAKVSINTWIEKYYTIPLSEYECVCNIIPTFDNLDEYIMFKKRFEEAYLWYLEVKRVHREDNMRLEEGLYEL